MFTRHNYTITVITVSVCFIAVTGYGYVYLAAVWYQNYLGKSTLESSIRTLPVMISGVIAAVSAD